MSVAAIRERLAGELEAILPRRRYTIISNVGSVDPLSKRLVQIEMSAFEPSANARGARLVEVTIHVATAKNGITKAAEDDADEAGLEVFEALESLTWANPTRAEKTVYKDKYLGYDITTQLLTKRSQ